MFYFTKVSIYYEFDDRHAEDKALCPLPQWVEESLSEGDKDALLVKGKTAGKGASMGWWGEQPLTTGPFPYIADEGRKSLKLVSELESHPQTKLIQGWPERVVKG